MPRHIPCSQVIQAGPGGSSWSALACTRQLAVCLVSLAALGGSGPCQARLIPVGPEDLVWWCAPGRADTAADDLAGVLYELLGVSEQAAHSHGDGGANVVVEVLGQVGTIAGQRVY
jgi:hypothetical protein